MPQQNRHASRNGAGHERANETNTIRSAADRLYRTATECVRQRERYARFVATGTLDVEQQAALRMACICDDLLLEAVRAYEKAESSNTPKPKDDWWHKANALWHACREYERRHHECDESSKKLSSRKPEKLGELAMEYDLEASALLALRLALAAYRKVCPDCELEDRPQTFVA